MKKLYKSLLFILGAGALLASCARPEELIEDIEYARVLTPLKFDAEVVASTGTDVTFSWQKIKNADGYELEVYEQTDDSDEVSTANTGTKVGETYILGADEVPYTVYALTVDKSFYARVRGTSTTLEPSNWTYLEKTFSTKAVRNSLNPTVTARTTNSVTIAWDNAADKADLTSVRVELVVGGAEATRVDITADDIAACSKTITGLETAREYRFTLLFGKAGERGSVTAFTRPNLEGVNTVASAAELYAAIHNQAGEIKVKVEYSDTELDFADAYPDPAQKLVTVVGDVYLYGVPTEDGKKPVLKTVDFNLAAGATVFHVEDLVLDGNGVGATVENLSADMAKIELVNSEITGYTKAIYSVAGGASAANVESFLVEGCYVHDINADGTQGGDFIDVRNGVNGDFVVRNTTFYACARTFFRISDSAKAESVLAENCTFNLVTATRSSSNNAGIFAVRVVTGAKSVKAVKNVFLNEISDGEDQSDASKCFVRLNRNSTDSYRVVSEGNLYYNLGAAFFVSNAVAAETDTQGDVAFETLSLTGGEILDTDPCVNSIAGKMYLAGTNGEKIKTLKAGDPRWWDAVMPEVIRETELTVAPDEYTWDFTEKTIYDTEELTANTIIGNARIYATASVPANVVMSKGIDFNAGASVSPDGVPTYSAVEVLTSGYGSVKVLGTSESGIGTLQVLAGGDRYVVLADGEEHTINLGDLVGENSIYVLANQALTLKTITWTKSLVPDVTVETLATPKITITPTKLDEGTSEDIVVSWPSVENAEDYVLTYQGAETILAEPGFTIPAADVAVLTAGEYTITVKARPVATSTKYVESAVAEATFKINKVVPPSGGEVTLTWDFSSAEWQSALSSQASAANNSDQTNWSVTLDDLTFNTVQKSKWNEAGYIQTGGASKVADNDRVFSFTAPAAGTLKVWASNTKSEDPSSRMVAVKVGDGDEQKGVALTSTTQVECEFDIAAGDVKIYGTSGIRIYKIQFNYQETTGTVTPPKEDHVWDFSSTEWQSALGSQASAANNSDQTNWSVTLDDLTFNTVQKSKWNEAGYIQTGGASKVADNDRVFSFSVGVAGTLTVWASNTKSEDPSSRMVAVKVGDGDEQKGVALTSTTQVECEFDIEAGDVKVYGTSGIRIYKIEFHSN